MNKRKQKLLKPSRRFRRKRLKKKVRRIIIDLSFGLVNKVYEFALLFWIFNEELVGSGGLHGQFARNLNKRLADQFPEVDSKQWFEGIRSIRRKHWVDESGAITNEGKERLRRLFPKLYSRKHWDGNWYLVIFDVPHKLNRKRDILREKLQSLGFGMLQKSIWISPVNFLGTVDKEVEELKLAPHVLCLETKNLGVENPKMLANRIWELDKLNNQYEKFIAKYEKGIEKEKFFQVFMKFMSIFQKDPQLPVEFLPSDWIRQEAYQLIQDYYSNLKFKNRFPKLL